MRNKYIKKVVWNALLCLTFSSFCLSMAGCASNDDITAQNSQMLMFPPGQNIAPPTELVDSTEQNSEVHLVPVDLSGGNVYLQNGKIYYTDANGMPTGHSMYVARPGAGDQQPAPLGYYHRRSSRGRAYGNYYIVHRGDTLYAISRKTGVSVGRLKLLNGLRGNAIEIGQRLRLSSLHASLSPAAQQVITEGGRPSVTKRQAPRKYVAVVRPPAARNFAHTPPAPPISAPQVNPASASSMAWPLRGRMVAAFGKKSGGQRNNGLDIAAPQGSSVKAAADGMVLYAGDSLKQFGKTVLISHKNKLVSVYANNLKLFVTRGQMVHRGQEIAKSGLLASSGQPGLHFEIRKNAQPVNPLQYLAH